MADIAGGITVIDEGQVATNGLWLTRSKFGHRITPHGDNCICVHKGYVFVAWYQGGMDNRSVWLSRKIIGDGGQQRDWIHIQFPHRHVMFRWDKDLPEEEKRGDSHNYISVGICPKDDTVHMIYDMHAYGPEDFRDDFFNYSFSKKGAATAPDEEWNSDLFYPKQNFLDPASVKRNPRAYHHATYPGFATTAEGDLIAKWRIGGHCNASMRLTRYDGKSWGPSRHWNECKGCHITGFYGSFREFNGQMVACWHRRHKADHEEGYINNRGLYLAFNRDESGLKPWSNTSGESFEIPLTDLDPFKIADPSKPGEKMSDSPSFVVTRGGAFHARVNINMKVNKHYFRLKPTDELQVSEGIPHGDMHAIGDRILIISLEDGRPIIKSAEAGTDNWKTELKITSGRKYAHGNTLLDGNSLFFFLMERVCKDRDSFPLHLLRFDIPETN